MSCIENIVDTALSSIVYSCYVQLTYKVKTSRDMQAILQ